MPVGEALTGSLSSIGLAMIPVVVQWLRYDAERTRPLDAELDAAEAAERP
jgi:hypothetical protein